MHGQVYGLQVIVNTAQFQAVVSFIEEETGFPHSRIEPATTLLDDIGIDGDDAEAFFLAFSKRFGVSLSGLELSRHFGGEGYSGCTAVFAIPFGLLPKPKRREPHARTELEPIRVEQLVEAAELRRWPASGEA